MKELPEARKVGVIGAGLAGLSTSAILSNMGYKVDVFEKNTFPGGVASTINEEGFTFDKGPSWVMMPEVFRMFYSKLGENIDEHLTLIKLNPQYKIFFEDGKTLTVPEGYENIRDEFSKFENMGGEKLDRFIEDSRKKYSVSLSKFLWHNYETKGELLKLFTMARKERIKLMESYHKHVSKYFKNKDLQKALEYTTVFLGGSPYNIPSIYDLMVSVDYDNGIWYPLGGIGKIVSSLFRIAEENGTYFHLGEEVKSLDIGSGKMVNGINTINMYYKEDYVVSASNYAMTETQLIDKRFTTYDEKFWKKRTWSPSVIMMYLGIEGKIENLEHHNLFLMDRWEDHFDTIYNKHTWPEKFSFYVSMTSKTDPKTAPKDHESVVVLIPVSPGLTGSEDMYEMYLRKVLLRIERDTGENLANRIVYKKIIGPEYFKNTYNSYEGTAFGLAHTLGQTAMFRPKNRSKKLMNLFYTGQYTNPGIGMPMVLISSMIVSEMINNFHMGVKKIEQEITIQ
ncbi:phytoene desaturase family protein [Caldiplasma sukawensis]